VPSRPEEGFLDSRDQRAASIGRPLLVHGPLSYSWLAARRVGAEGTSDLFRRELPGGLSAVLQVQTVGSEEKPRDQSGTVAGPRLVFGFHGRSCVSNPITLREVLRPIAPGSARLVPAALPTETGSLNFFSLRHKLALNAPCPRPSQFRRDRFAGLPAGGRQASKKSPGAACFLRPTVGQPHGSQSPCWNAHRRWPSKAEPTLFEPCDGKHVVARAGAGGWRSSHSFT